MPTPGAPPVGPPWAIEHRRGTAAELHAASSDLVAAPAARRAVILEAIAPAVVLGSAEPADHVDRAVADRLGYQVVRRRSGGAAVLVGPGRALWVDVVLPRDDPLWSDDVGVAAWWLGDAWATALAGAGLPGAVAHRGAMVRGRWSDRVCFAGLGPGEVIVGGAKVVGVAQRRTRHGALFQCSVCGSTRPGWRSWEPAELLGVLAWAPGERDAAAEGLAGAAMETGDLERVEEALIATFTGSAADGAPGMGQVP